MNSTIRPTLLPAAPGPAKARLPDKTEAVDMHASFAAALKALAEGLADRPIATEDTPAPQGKLPQRGKSLKAADEPVNEGLAVMLAAAAMPLTTSRSSAPLASEVAVVHNVLSLRGTGPKQATLPSEGVKDDEVISFRAKTLLTAMPGTGAAVPAAGDTPTLHDDPAASDAGRLTARATQAVPSSDVARTPDLLRSLRTAENSRSDTPVAAEMPLAPTPPTRRAIGMGPTPAAGAVAGALPATETRGAAAAGTDAAAAAARAGPLLAARLQTQEGVNLAREIVGREAQTSADAPAPELLPGLAVPGAASVHAAPQPALVQVSPPVGSSDWGEVLAQHLVRLAPRGHRELELNLNPAELGPLKVTLSLTDGHAQIIFASEHPAVRLALEAALPQLRTTFADNGISLGQTSVGSGSGEPRPENAPGGHHRARQTDPAPFSAAPPGPPRPVALAARSSGSAVDTFA